MYRCTEKGYRQVPASALHGCSMAPLCRAYSNRLMAGIPARVSRVLQVTHAMLLSPQTVMRVHDRSPHTDRPLIVTCDLRHRRSGAPSPNRSCIIARSSVAPRGTAGCRAAPRCAALRCLAICCARCGVAQRAVCQCAV
jgi:hypothetical protein